MQRFGSNGELPFARLSTPTDLSPQEWGRAAPRHRGGALHAIDDAMFRDAYCFRSSRRVARPRMLRIFNTLFVISVAAQKALTNKWHKLFFKLFFLT